MKKITYILLFITLYSFGQKEHKQKIKYIDSDKNEGYFNITKFSYIKVNSLKQDFFIEGEGGKFRELESDNANAWSLQTINGYFLTPSFSLGLGIGLDGHHNPNYNTLPIFLDIRAYFSEEGNSVYSYLDIGPTIRLGKDNSQFRKGVLFNLGIGYKFNFFNNTFLVSDIFYSHKTVSMTSEGIGKSDNTIKSNGVGLSLGVIF